MSELRYVEVFVIFLSPENGGRKSSFYLDDHGYKPHFRIPPDGEYLGVEFVDGPDNLPPGNQTYATVRFLYEPDICYDALVVGAEFEILEGPRVIGYGTVTRR